MKATWERKLHIVKGYRLPHKANFNNYNPETFGWGGHLDPTTENNSHLIVPLEYKGVEFPGGVHRDFRNLAHNFLQDLYPHIPVVSHSKDPHRFLNGQCGCYVNRDVRGSSSRSFHSWGLAIDINWSENPMGLSSRYGESYVLPHLTSALTTRWGMEWGGDWMGRRDAMHVECHLSPQDARKVKLHSKKTIIFLSTRKTSKAANKESHRAAPSPHKKEKVA